MSKRLTRGLLALTVVFAGLFAVPAPASAAFTCSGLQSLGSIDHRACIDFTAQGGVWFEVQYFNRAWSAKSYHFTFIAVVQGRHVTCDGGTRNIAPLGFHKYTCSHTRQSGYMYQTLSYLVVSGPTQSVARSNELVG